jgi:hypothetical protein
VSSCKGQGQCGQVFNWLCKSLGRKGFGWNKMQLADAIQIYGGCCPGTDRDGGGTGFLNKSGTG